MLDVRKCLLQPDPSNAIRDEIKRYALEKGLDFFDPRTNQGLLRTLMLRISQTTGEVMLLVQFGREDRPAREGLLDHLHERFPQITSLLYAINEKVNDSVYDLDIRTYRGSDHITERMEDLVFRIGPKSFFQTNTPQALRLYRVVRTSPGLPVRNPSTTSTPAPGPSPSSSVAGPGRSWGWNPSPKPSTLPAKMPPATGSTTANTWWET